MQVFIGITGNSLQDRVNKRKKKKLHFLCGTKLRLKYWASLCACLSHSKKRAVGFFLARAVPIQVQNLCVCRLIFMAIAPTLCLPQLHEVSGYFLQTWRLFTAVFIHELPVCCCCSNTSPRAGRTGCPACPCWQRLGATH